LKENGIETLIGKSYKELAHTKLRCSGCFKGFLAKPLTNSSIFFYITTGSFFFNSRITTLIFHCYKNTSNFWNYNFAYGGTFTSTEKLQTLMKIIQKIIHKKRRDNIIKTREIFSGFFYLID
jgi:hypothetical protein